MPRKIFTKLAPNCSGTNYYLRSHSSSEKSQMRSANVGHRKLRYQLNAWIKTVETSKTKGEGECTEMLTNFFQKKSS